MALLAVLFGLLAAVGFGVSDFFGAKVAKRLGGNATSVLIITTAAAVYALVYVAFLRKYTTFNGPAVGYAVASGMAFTVANLCFYRALARGPVNIVSPLSSLYPLVTLLLLVLAFGSKMSLQQVIGMVIVVCGAAVASGLFDKSTGKRRIGRGPLLALVAALSWGFAFCFIARAVDLGGWQFPSLVELCTGAILFWLSTPLLNRAEPGLYKKLLPGFCSPMVLVAGVLIEVAFLSVTFGIGRVGNLASVVVAISACYPVLTAFLALRRLKEEFRPVPLSGAFLAVAGVVVLTLG